MYASKDFYYIHPTLLAFDATKPHLQTSLPISRAFFPFNITTESNYHILWSWVWDSLLEYRQPTHDHITNEKWLFLPEHPLAYYLGVGSRNPSLIYTENLNDLIFFISSVDNLKH